MSIVENALDKGRGPKYLRLAHALQSAIQSGVIAQGTKLPPHRVFADELAITPGTVSRAYAELERLGLVAARVGDGTYVHSRQQERARDTGFRNFVDAPALCHDMSRNMHIPGQEAALLARDLAQLSQSPHALQELMLYTPDAGLPHHRQAGARWIAHGEFAPSADQVLCVNGSQHGLLCALMALVRPGDTLVTEQLTYPGLVGLARFLGIKLLDVAMDNEGLMPESLDEICRANRVTAVYCTPTIQNPTTAVMSPKRRQVIASICREHNLVVIEDETHGVLMEDRPLPISYFAPERGVLISSLSKAVAAGLRAGFLHVPAPLVSRQGAAIRASSWMAAPLGLEIASRWIEDGTARALLHQQITEIERRKTLVSDCLAGLNYRTHDRSPHFWIEVPAPWRSAEVEHQLRQRNHLISVAEAFSVGRGVVPHFVRASVSNASGGEAMLLEGFERLGDLLRAGMQSSHTPL
ncbi:PLP-dependent aminotransferase family protein [Burkholderia sp. Bp9140]|uniref:aminotransferase-like domain-containing protein n=1 Tax=Burkholderia sp. Bp9140 TaxID=2184572 RepID=UPI002892F781|nr:PLP-dependent aminotransferase family protein [Burkholderia sp. Bp9140]